MAGKRGSRDDEGDEILSAPPAKRERQASSSAEETEEVADVAPELSDEDLGDELSDDDGEFEDVSKADIENCSRRNHAHAGVLDSVRLDRFMSHECFEYKLGPNVNIINGPNGMRDYQPQCP